MSKYSKLISFVFWMIALVFTLFMAMLQRTTGPTYPLSGSIDFGSETYHYELNRSHGLAPDKPELWDMPVEIEVDDPDVDGQLVWKRYKYDESWKIIQMDRDGSILHGVLPHQPPAGKLEYQVVLTKNEDRIMIPEGEPVVTRFKGAVPAWALIPHVILMFVGLFFASRTALAAIFNQKLKWLLWTTFILFVAGGLIFGPIVQKYAFDAYWTGWPYGGDWTDNKTAIMVIAWIPALWFIRKNAANLTRLFALIAMLVTFAVYIIPHSIHGSELDYSTIMDENGKPIQNSGIILE